MNHQAECDRAQVDERGADKPEFCDARHRSSETAVTSRIAYHAVSPRPPNGPGAQLPVPPPGFTRSAQGSGPEATKGRLERAAAGAAAAPCEAARETECFLEWESLSEAVRVADNHSQPGLERDADATTRSGISARAGVILLGLSLALWVPLPAVLFLPLSTGAKATLGGGLVVGAEIAFWLGAVLAGPEAARRTRSWIRRALPKRRPSSR